MSALNVSARLHAVISMIEGATLADIGTDHAYVPIAACLENLCKNAIACDIKPGPLARATENISAFGLTDRIETRMGDGLGPIKPGEADCIVISGMGGMRIIGILEESPETVKSAGKIIMQPQHDTDLLRRRLHQLGLYITAEAMVREEDRFYMLVAARPGTEIAPWTDEEYLLGKYLIERNDPVLKEYLSHILEKISAFRAQIAASGGDVKAEAEWLAMASVYKSLTERE